LDDSLATVAGITLVCLIQRLSLTWRQTNKFDTWAHIYFTLAVRDQGRGPFAPIMPRVVEAAPYHYPFLAHWLIGRLPRRVITHHSRFINPVADALFTGAAGLFLLARGVDGETVALALALYVFSPLFFSKVAIGPRVADYTTRLYSEIALTAFFLVAIFGTGAPPAVDIGLSAVLLGYIMLSSKFGIQAVAFLVLPYGVATLSAPVGLSLLAALLLSFAVSRGQFRNMLQSQYGHLAWYFSASRGEGTFSTSRNALSHLVAWDREKPLRSNGVRLIFNLVARNSFTALVIKAPAVVALGVLWLSGADAGRLGPPAADIAVLCLISFAVFLIINTKRFLFLGEAERYVSHIGPLAVLLAASMMLQPGTGPVAVLLIGYGVLYWLVEIVLLGGLRLYGGDDRVGRRLIDRLRAAPAPTTVLAYPLHVLAPARIMIETDHRPISPLMARGPGTARLRELAPYPHADLSRLDEIVEAYDVGIIIIRERDLDERMPGFRPDAERWSVERVGDGDEAALYLVRRDLTAPAGAGAAG
jgi:hypothetical protein